MGSRTVSIPEGGGHQDCDDDHDNMMPLSKFYEFQNFATFPPSWLL